MNEEDGLIEPGTAQAVRARLRGKPDYQQELPQQIRCAPPSLAISLSSPSSTSSPRNRHPTISALQTPCEQDGGTFHTVPTSGAPPIHPFPHLRPPRPRLPLLPPTFVPPRGDAARLATRHPRVVDGTVVEGCTEEEGVALEETDAERSQGLVVRRRCASFSLFDRPIDSGRSQQTRMRTGLVSCPGCGKPKRPHYLCLDCYADIMLERGHKVDMDESVVLQRNGRRRMGP